MKSLEYFDLEIRLGAPGDEVIREHIERFIADSTVEDMLPFTGNHFEGTGWTWPRQAWALRMDALDNHPTISVTTVRLIEGGAHPRWYDPTTGDVGYAESFGVVVFLDASFDPDFDVDLTVDNPDYHTAKCDALVRGDYFVM